MLTKLKCFFGLHEWMCRDQDGPHNGRVLKERMCDNCKKEQKQVLVTQLIPEIPTEHCPKVAVWANTTPDKPAPPPKSKSYTLCEFEVYENIGAHYNSYWIRLKSNKESFLTKFSGVKKWDHFNSDFRDFIFESSSQAVDHLNNFIRSQNDE